MARRSCGRSLRGLLSRPPRARSARLQQAPDDRWSPSVCSSGALPATRPRKASSARADARVGLGVVGAVGDGQAAAVRGAMRQRPVVDVQLDRPVLARGPGGADRVGEAAQDQRGVELGARADDVGEARRRPQASVSWRGLADLARTRAAGRGGVRLAVDAGQRLGQRERVGVQVEGGVRAAARRVERADERRQAGARRRRRSRPRRS